MSAVRIVSTLILLALASSPALAANDEGAGAWQMLVLTSPAQIQVAPPLSTGSVDYQAELTAIKNAQGTVIGAIGVSGSTVENDHTVAEAGAQAALSGGRGVTGRGR